MNKGLGKLILIAGLGLGALYFLKSDSKKVSNSEVKKETKEHPSLDKETIETIVEDHKEVKKEEPKKVHRNKMTKEEFLAKMKAGREKKKMSKAEAGKLGGEATAELGKHKGHKSKKGLVQDQNKVSKEEHEKHYQKSKGNLRTTIKDKDVKKEEKNMLDLDNLEQYYGSENYHNVMGVNVTDGIKYIMNNGYSWVVTDAIVICKMKLKKHNFISIKLNVDNKKAIVEYTDGNTNVLYSQKYEYTDARKNIKMYFTDNVLMLANEY